MTFLSSCIQCLTALSAIRWLETHTPRHRRHIKTTSRRHKSFPRIGVAQFRNQHICLRNACLVVVSMLCRFDVASFFRYCVVVLMSRCYFNVVSLSCRCLVSVVSLSCRCLVSVVSVSCQCRVVVVSVSCQCRVVVVSASCQYRVVVVSMFCQCRIVVHIDIYSYSAICPSRPGTMLLKSLLLSCRCLVSVVSLSCT